MNKNDTLTEIANRHQVYIERYKAGVVDQYAPFLMRMAKVIRKKLGGEDLEDASRTHLEKLIRAVNKDLKIIQGKYVSDVFITSSLDLALYESEFEIKSLNQVVRYDFITPTEQQLKTAITINPLNIGGADSGKLLDKYVADLSNGSIDTLTNAIRQGVFLGESADQIVKDLIGTKALRFTDGKLYKTQNTIDMMVRTSLQHVSAQARQETLRRNDDIIIGFKIVVTFDGRTSVICRGYGSTPDKIYQLNKDPVPPFHPYCRSSFIGALDPKWDDLDRGATRSSRGADGKVKSIPATTDYYSWLKTQPADFQDSVIGSTRGKLLRNGGLTSKRFGELQLSKKFEPLETITRNGVKITPIQQMRELEPIAFQNANL